MNSLEVGTLAIAVALSYLFFKRIGVPRRHALWLTLLAAVPLYYSLVDASQMLTTDETYIEPELINIHTHAPNQWNYGFLHTTYALLTPLFDLARHAVTTDDQWLKGIGKILHWLTGFLSFLGIGWVFARLYVEKKSLSLFLALFFAFSFLLPTDVMALKMFNYDLLSCTLGVLAVLLMTEAIRDESLRLAYFAVAAASLSAQEKITGSPLLLFALVSLGYVARKTARPRGKSGTWAFKALAGYALSVGIFYLTYEIVHVMHGQDPFSLEASSLFYPLVGWAIPFVVRLVSGNRPDYPLWLAVLPALAALGGGALGPWVWRKLKSRAEKTLWWISLGLLAMVFVCGIIGTYGVTAQLAIPRLFPSDVYRPNNIFNAVIVHFSSKTALEHFLRNFAWTCAIYLNAIPSVVWLGVACALTPKLTQGLTPARRLGLRATLAFALFGPLLFGLTRTPVLNRYFNIFIYLLALCSVLGMVLFISKRRHAAIAIASAASLLLFAETFAFGPLYAPFRPFWVSYGESYDEMPVRSVLNPSWTGLGEEIMLAGKEINRLCEAGAPCNDVRVYCTYTGEWNLSERPYDLRCINDLVWAGEKDFRTTDQDYYVINRTSVFLGFNFPWNVKPLFTIRFRGFDQAWVFRGDQLKGLGYRYRPEGMAQTAL